MKRSPDYLLRRTADSIVIVPVGRAASAFPGMITVNETGAFLWDLLAEDQTEQTLTAALLAHYDVPEPTASADVAAFLKKLHQAGAVI